MKKIMFAVLLLLVTASAFAQGPAFPPGKWWRKQEVVNQLALTKEQQSRLDEIFNATATQLVDLKAEVEKRTIELRNDLDRPQVTRQEVQKDAARLSDARAKLFEREILMLVDMRGVLSEDQWSKIREFMEDRQQHGGRQGGRKMMPPPGGRPGGGPGGNRPPRR